MREIKNSLREIPSPGSDFEFGKVKSVEERHKNSKMEISFHFDISQEKNDLLQSRIDRGEILTPEELNTTFSPDSDEVNNLINWLESNGFTNVRQSHDKLNVYAKSTAKNISEKLSCELVAVENELGDFVSVSTNPSIPKTLSTNITSINGLQPFLLKKKKIEKTNDIRNWRNFNRYNTLLSGKPPYIVNEILSAYNGLGMTYSGVNQTIGILIDCPPNNSDMTKFWTANGISNNLSRLQTINVRGVSLPAPTGEESLDAQWTSGIAKDSQIKIYCSGDLSFTSLDLALDRIYLDASTDPKLRQISVSLGLGERFMSSGQLNTENTKYQRLRALGVNCFISSGDSGSREGGLLGVSFPASNPNVVAVGGTRLTLNSSSIVLSETAWTGSGGGISIKYPKQTWQSSLSGSGRLVPDVSAAADPQTGAYVVLAGSVYQIGGTSWSAPVWAGICALINDARTKANKTRIGFLPPLIYTLIRSTRFRDITSGRNGDYSAGVGYDLVTGIGTPNIRNLITYFLSLP